MTSEGVRGVPKKQTKGAIGVTRGRGSKNPIFLWTLYMETPLAEIHTALVISFVALIHPLGSPVLSAFVPLGHYSPESEFVQPKQMKTSWQQSEGD